MMAEDEYDGPELVGVTAKAVFRKFFITKH
jgi:hypothetical protein